MSTDELNFDREERRAQRQRRHRRRVRKRRILLALIALLVIGAVAGLAVHLLGGSSAPAADPAEPENTAVLAAVTPPPTPSPTPTPAPTPEPEPIFTTENTVTVAEDFPSQFVLLVDAATGEVLVERGSEERINPASMTKLLTLLVAVEQIHGIGGAWTMTAEATEYCFVNECSVVGFETGETIPVEELFYGCILSSGADACLGLAEIAAGSHEAFVGLMNEKLEELGLSDTAHFTNCVGLYDENHYCTLRDIAIILQAALENDFCREVLYTSLLISKPTAEHPDGQVLRNLFLSRIGGRDTGGVSVLAAKTGYVVEAGCCAASYGETADGTAYLCVTAKSPSSWQTVYDHAALYQEYCS